MTNYHKIFFDNLLFGAKIGQAVIVSCIITKNIPLNQFPFYNRFLEVGFYNIIQHEYFSSIPLSNFKDPINNSIYKGTFQSVKWLPNLWTQNYVKEIIPSYLPKSLLIPLSGMTPFFTIGAIEAEIIKNPTTKIVITNSLAAAFAIIPSFYSVEETIKTSNGAILLTPKDSVLTQAGLIASYLFMDLAHILKIPKTFENMVSLPTLTITLC